MKTNDFSYYIERYNSGEMDESEKSWFLKEIEGNEELRKEVTLRKQSDNILKERDIITLRNKLADIEKKRTAVFQLNKSGKYSYLKYAALVGGFIIVGSFLFFPGQRMNNEELADRYYKTYEAPTANRSANKSGMVDFSRAMEYYKSRDYEKAVVLFKKVVENNPRDMQSTLLNGISNFEIKKYPEAKSSFKNVIDDNNNLFIDQAQWYLSLCYLKTGEKEMAASLLKVVKENNSIYSNDAKRILRKLK
jgi:tetratricopeptide (TPR) repeat protein